MIRHDFIYNYNLLCLKYITKNKTLSYISLYFIMQLCYM